MVLHDLLSPASLVAECLHLIYSEISNVLNMVSQEWVRDSRRCLVCIYVNLHRQKVSGEIVEIVAGARLQKLLEFEGGDDPERLHTPGLEEVERVLGVP